MTAATKFPGTQGLGPALKAAGADIADSPFGTWPVDAVLTISVAGDAASGVGLVKFPLDAATFLRAAGACQFGAAR